VLPLLNRYARVPVCGLIAYNGEIPQDETGISRTMITVLRRSLLVRGFINTEFVPDHYESFLKELSSLVAYGKIR
jgi:NADPH-dependent curcumin reductase CurA